MGLIPADTSVGWCHLCQIAGIDYLAQPVQSLTSCMSPHPHSHRPYSLSLTPSPHTHSLTPPAGISPIVPALIALYRDSFHLQTSTLFRSCRRCCRLVPACSLDQWQQHFSRSDFCLENNGGNHLLQTGLSLPAFFSLACFCWGT